MKVPANLPADRLLLEYLSGVAQAGNRYLPKGARMAFVASTRARIEQECGEGLGDAERVQAVLASLGDPETLVRQERARLDAQWVKRRAADKEAGEAAAAAITGPREYRPITSRWRPATDAHLHLSVPGKGRPGAVPEGSSAGQPGSWARQRKGRIARLLSQQLGQPPAEPAAAGPAAAEPAAAGPATGPAPEAAGPAPGAAGPAPGAGELPAPGTDTAGLIPWASQPSDAATTRVTWPDDAGRTARGTGFPGAVAAALRRWAGRSARELARLARRYPLEAVALALLGVGGLILPFPFWLLGGILAVWSRRWGPMDKWIAFLGPVLLALAGTVVTALLVHGHGNPVVLYSHALRLDVGILLRAGSVLCAGYLVAQLRREPTGRVPPWRR